MQEIRCGQCFKKMGEGIYQVLSIKCSRCKTLNNLKQCAPSAPFECHCASKSNLPLEDAHVCQNETSNPKKTN